jgi:hypothetical protein
METQTSRPVRLSQKSRLRILAVMVMLTITVLVSIGWVSFEDIETNSSLKVEALNAAETSLKATLSQQQASQAGKDALLENAASTIDVFNATLNTMSAQVNSLQATQTAQSRENDSLAASLQAYREASRQDQARLDQIQSELICDNSSYFKADYSSNSAMATSLKAFIGEIGGNFAYASWDFLWPASKNAIHRVTVVQDGRSFTNIFVVYYEEIDFSNKGVFWVNRACWIDK